MNEKAAELSNHRLRDSDFTIRFEDHSYSIWPPYYLPVHIRDESDPSKFAWVHSSRGVVGAADGLFVPVPESEVGIGRVVEELKMLPAGAFGVLIGGSPTSRSRCVEAIRAVSTISLVIACADHEAVAPVPSRVAIARWQTPSVYFSQLANRGVSTPR